MVILNYLEKFQCNKKKCKQEILIPIHVIKKDPFFKVELRCPSCFKKYKLKLPIHDKRQWVHFLQENFPRCDACGTLNKYLIKLQRDDFQANLLSIVFDTPHHLGIECINCHKLRKKVISRGCWDDVLESNPNVQIISTPRPNMTMTLVFDKEKALTEAEQYSQLADQAYEEGRYNDYILNTFEMFERQIKYLSMSWLGGFAEDASLAQLISDLRTKAITLPDPEKNQYWQNIHDKVKQGIYNLEMDEVEAFYKYCLRLSLPVEDFLKFERNKIKNPSPSGEFNEFKFENQEADSYKNQQSSMRKALEEIQANQPPRDNIRTCPFCGTENTPLAEYCQGCGTWLPPQ